MYCVAYGYYQVIIRFIQVMTTFWPDVAHGVCAEWRKPYSHADSESREAVLYSSQSEGFRKGGMRKNDIFFKNIWRYKK